MFIDDEAEVKLLPLHLPQDVFKPSRINDVIWLDQNVCEFERPRAADVGDERSRVNETRNVIK